jgi:hypothetical protein
VYPLLQIDLYKEKKGNSTAILTDKAILNHYRKNRTIYRNTKQNKPEAGRLAVF